MTPRDLAARALFHFAAFLMFAAALLFSLVAPLFAELADEVKASRRTNNRILGRNIMSKENRKLTDVVSQHRAINARLAATVGNTEHARAELAQAKRIGEWWSTVGRAS